MLSPRTIRLLALCAFASLLSVAARAEKTYGECEVSVAGANSLSYNVLAMDPRKSHDHTGTAKTLSWAIVQEEAVHKVDAERMKLLESASMYLLSMACIGEKGRFNFMPTPNSTAKEIPIGPGKYRLIGMGGNGRKPGDLIGSLMIVGSGPPVLIQPKEPGEVIVTRNDRDALEGTFKFTDGKNTVTGKFKFLDPYL